MGKQDAIEEFRRRVMLCEGMTTRQVAWHEAGHMLFWRAFFPGVKVRYMVRGDSLPCVSPVKPRPFVVDDLSPDEAGRVAMLKMGGVAAEMILLGLDGTCGDIADWLSGDYLSPVPVLDWADDLEFGGDIAQALSMLRQKGGIGPLAVNFARCLSATVATLKANSGELETEAGEALKLFSTWKKQGRWRL